MDLPRRGGPVPRLFGQRRVGHAGTLDPDATGVLLVGLGRATRLLRFLTALGEDLHRRGGARDGHLHPRRLGRGGGHAGTCPGSPSTEARAAAAALTGEIEQVPPMVSAVKVGGRRLHALARAGHRGRAGAPAGDRAPLRRSADRPSPGSSRSRSSARRGPTCGCWPPTWAPLLGGGAHLRNLRRTRSGSFTVAEAHRAGGRSVPATCSPRSRPCATSRPSAVDRRGGPVGRHGPARSTGCRWGHRRRALGPGRRSAGSCSPSTRPPTPTACGRRWCSARSGRARHRPPSILPSDGGPPARPVEPAGRGDRGDHRRLRRRPPRPPAPPVGAWRPGPPSAGCATPWSPSTATRPPWCAPSRPRCC